MSMPNRMDVLEQMEREGLFEVARRGDQRGASLFARLAAYRMNPTGDRASFGWLTKTPGETQVDGYAEDSIVYGDSPSDLSNVVDIVGGAGAPGASLAWQVKGRRPTNTWDRPRPLTDEELRYLGARPVPNPGEPPPIPGTPPDVCQYNPAAILELKAELGATYALLAALVDEQMEQRERLDRIARLAQEAANLVGNLSDRFEAGMPIVEGRAGWAGTLSGKVKG